MTKVVDIKKKKKVKEKEDLVLGELYSLMKNSGGLLKPEGVVDFARDPQTALHKKFEWDDTKAAREHRLWQARELFKVFVKVIREDLPPFNVFVSLKDDRYGENRGGYRLTTDVLQDEELSGMMLDDAKADWQSYKTKYHAIKVLHAAFQAMDAALHAN